MERWQEDFINAKYHLAVVDRMFKSYEEIEGKRFLVGIINELARSASSLVRAYLIYEGVFSRNSLRNLRVFMEKVGLKYLEKEDIQNIFRIFEVEKAQKISPIEYSKGDKIILLINRKYRFLTALRLKEFEKSLKKGVFAFSENFRQI